MRPEFVHQATAQHRQKHFTLVIVPHGPAELFVRHSRVVFDGAPQIGQLLALDDAEDSVVDVLPPDHAGTVFRIVQQIADEFPQLAVAPVLFPAPAAAAAAARTRAAAGLVGRRARPAHSLQQAGRVVRTVGHHLR